MKKTKEDSEEQHIVIAGGQGRNKLYIFVLLYVSKPTTALYSNDTLILMCKLMNKL